MPPQLWGKVDLIRISLSCLSTSCTVRCAHRILLFQIHIIYISPFHKYLLILHLAQALWKYQFTTFLMFEHYYRVFHSVNKIVKKHPNPNNNPYFYLEVRNLSFQWLTQVLYNRKARYPPNVFVHKSSISKTRLASMKISNKICVHSRKAYRKADRVHVWYFASSETTREAEKSVG